MPTKTFHLPQHRYKQLHLLKIIAKALSETPKKRPVHGTAATEKLKKETGCVDTFYSMIRLTLMDGSLLEIPREEALEFLPYRHVLKSPVLKHPIEGLVIHLGKIVPVLGPMPKPGEENLDMDQRPWIFLMKTCAQVVRGLPEFQEGTGSKVVPLKPAEGEESSLLDELDQLLKGA